MLRDGSAGGSYKKKSDGALGGSQKKVTLIKSKPPTKTKITSVTRSDTAKAIKQSYSAQRIQPQTMKNSLVHHDGSGGAGKASELYNELSDRQKRKGIHYNSVGRGAAASTSTNQKKGINRQGSFSGSQGAKRMSEQRWNYLKIHNIQQRVLNTYSQGRQRDSP